MAFLLIVILSNTLLSIIFKLFPKFGINALQAIVVNYWTCVITGSIYFGEMPISTASINASWFLSAIIMGLSFISIFNLLAYCTRINGITTATIANKLSLVIPALLSIILYSESVTVTKILGIALAFPAVYLTTRVKDENRKTQNIFIPALLFLLSGLLDSFVKYTEHSFLSTPTEQAVFSIHAFAIAGAAGTILVTFLALTGKMKLQWRNVIAGICLGIPNYFSIYLFIRLLHSNFLQSSAAIPINNIGIVITSALAAIILFKEKLSPQRIIGLILAVVAILLILFNGRSL